MRLVRSLRKLVTFAFCLSCFFLTTLPLVPWLQRDGRKVRPILVRATAVGSAFMSWVLGLEVEVVGEKEALLAPGARLVVSNHQTYLDVLILATLRPSCFVTSQEIRRTPGLGIICRAGGCLFVDRQNRRNLGGEVKELSQAMRDGMVVTIFPEATSTDGSAVLRFRRPLFSAAIDAQVPVLPVTINYLSLDGAPVTHRNRDSVCWYGDMDFFPSIMGVMAAKRLKAQVVIGTLIPPTGDAQTLSEAAYEQVTASFRSLAPPT